MNRRLGYSRARWLLFADARPRSSLCSRPRRSGCISSCASASIRVRALTTSRCSRRLPSAEFLFYELLRNLFRREFGSDLLAGISIVTSVLLNEYLAGAIVVLMLSGGEALENYALRNASSSLRALAKKMPAIAHRKQDSVIAM
jgi:cation transport ATPase